MGHARLVNENEKTLQFCRPASIQFAQYSTKLAGLVELWDAAVHVSGKVVTWPVTQRANADIASMHYAPTCRPARTRGPLDNQKEFEFA
jgi:hypothetical protein